MMPVHQIRFYPGSHPARSGKWANTSGNLKRLKKRVLPGRFPDMQDLAACIRHLLPERRQGIHAETPLLTPGLVEGADTGGDLLETGLGIPVPDPDGKQHLMGH